MKKFAFPLDRVLAWRRMQARLEEMTLERLNAERRALESRALSLQRELTGVVNGLLRGGRITGTDLEALDRFRQSSAREVSRVEASMGDLDRKIAAQMEAVSGRRRDARLIERLRDEKFSKWRAEFQKEIDREAGEAHLAKHLSKQRSRPVL